MFMHHQVISCSAFTNWKSQNGALDRLSPNIILFVPYIVFFSLFFSLHAAVVSLYCIEYHASIENGSMDGLSNYYSICNQLHWNSCFGEELVCHGISKEVLAIRF